MISKAILTVIIWDLTITNTQKMICYKNKKIKRRRCQEWEEMIWKEQPLTYLPNPIVILNKRKCVEIVRIRIMLLDINVKIVNYLFNLCKIFYYI
jgi:hypothetical protein